MPGARRVIGVCVQVVGGAIGVGLAVWAVDTALGQQNEASLEALSAAPAWVFVALIVLSVVSLGLNGLVFHAGAKPLHLGIPAWRVLGVNIIATFLSVLPFKLGLLARVGIHRRLDDVLFVQIAAWMVGLTALTGAVLLPMAGAAAVEPWVGRWWLALAVVGPVLGVAAVYVAAQYFSKRAWMRKTMLGSGPLLRSRSTLATVLLLRGGDVAVQAMRFWIAAHAADVGLTFEQALVLAATYFLIQASSPAGALGVAEGGTVWLGALGGLEPGSIALVALVVSAAHYGTSGAASLVAAAALRLDRTLRVSIASETSEDTPPEDVLSHDAADDRA
jgi:uncharacterized membrane protein YbhN (UPF0104 family)